jgi:hypothetical protein
VSLRHSFTTTLEFAMAQKTTVSLVDDLDDTPIAEGDGETVRFTYRGTSYEIDLNNKNLEKLDKALEKYIGAARKTSAPSGRRTGAATTGRRSASDTDPKAVRAWAEANGITVNPRGRLSAEVVEKYKAAGN